MGQAMVDLPDPLETPRASGLGADDLLAQMAGDEIDRLLAEAEAETPKVRQPPRPVEDDSFPVAAPQGPARAFVPAPAVPATAAVAPSSSVVDPLAGELDSLLESLTSAKPPVSNLTPALGDSKVEAAEPERIASTIAVAETSISADESAALFSTPAEEAVAAGLVTPPTVEETTAAERSALAMGESPIESSALGAAPSAVETAASAELLDAPASLPRLLLPLEWINAPLSACPDLLREFIGKAAIITVLNALGVIFYVRFIRRH
jgi:hypothetical protein